jgi:hypothetical protein
MKLNQSVLLILTCLVLGLITRGLSAEQSTKSEPTGYPVVVKVEAAEFEAANLQMIDPTHEACCRVRAGSGLGSGTCFLVSESGDAYFLTNYHVAGKKNSNVKIELWRSGKLQPPLNGRVVLAIINDGYVDGAVVRVAADEVNKYGTQAYIPISLPSEPAPDYSTILSRGCPGGTWQTQFIGSVFDKTADVIKFHPRPGGGRSGSSVIDPSTGKPGHEQHGTDGSSPASGFGIAMTRDVIWNILQNKMPTSASSRPAGEIPLLFMQDEDFKTDPEEYDATLRRLRDRKSADGEADRADRPRLFPQREFRLGDRLFGFVFKLVLLVLLIFALAYAGYRLAKKFLLLGLFLAVITMPGLAGLAQGQDYQSQLAPLAERWSAEAVNEPTIWLEHEQALEAAGKSGGSLLVLMTTEGCPPCAALKAELESLSKETHLNHSFLTQLEAGNPEQVKLMDRLLPDNLKTNRSYPILVIYYRSQADGAPNWRRQVVLGNPFSSGTEPKLKTYLQQIGVR